MNLELTAKYNVPGPRYTSYPTVPYWQAQTFTLPRWKASVTKNFQASNSTEGVSLYIHLPFCESMCTFCGCNKRITRNHGVEIPYIDSVLKEWRLYRELFDEIPRIKEIHLGGGTPTFFSSENLKKLMDGIFRFAEKCEDAELSFEGHPNNTSQKHLQTLAALGFRRVSYGVQDYNETVQRAIHRVQPFENVRDVTRNARELGYESIGHDIIFGLPFQTTEHVKHTINKTLELRPDRIAFYSYAHVPWIKGNGQRGFKEEDLPKASEKRRQYETGKKMLLEAGYVEIGMDHFALPSDSLYKAQEVSKLHRNFMGYTSSKTRLMIGLGVSAISDSWQGFAQNVKGVEAYQGLLENDILPIFRGHVLSAEDELIRKHILNLMCRMKTSWYEPDMKFEGLYEVLYKLQEMESDGLVKINPNGLEITEVGRPFVRNVCMAFDLKLQERKPDTQLFSMTI